MKFLDSVSQKLRIIFAAVGRGIAAAYREIAKMIKHFLTAADGDTYDPARIVWAMGVLAFFGMSFYLLVMEAAKFSLSEWAASFAGVQVSGAGGVLIKSSTEPKE